MMKEVSHRVLPESGTPIKAVHAAPLKMASITEDGLIVIRKNCKLSDEKL